MAKYVLDTQSAVFSLVAPRRLGRRARAAMQRVDTGRDEAWLPAAAVAEIVMLRELGRVEIGLPQVRAVLDDVPSVRFLALDYRQLDIFSTLGGIREPFDRLIVAAARSIEAKLITKDVDIAASGLVEAVWS